MTAGLATLIIGVILGYVGQRSRMCFVGGIRDFILVRDTYLLKGLMAFGVTAWLGFPIAAFIAGAPAGPFGASDAVTLVLAVFGGLGVGYFSTLANGCPLRQHVLAAQGVRSSIAYLGGFFAGAVIFHVWVARLLFRVLPVAAIVMIGGCSAGSEPEPQPNVVLRLMTSPANRAIGEALVLDYARTLPTFHLELLDTPGVFDSVLAIQNNTADFAFTLADISYLAFAGGLDGVPQRFSSLRGIAVLDLAPVHLLVGPDAAIDQFADLRGHAIGIGPPGSATGLVAEMVLNAFQIDRETTRINTLPFSVAMTMLVSGQLQAMFVTVSDPADNVAAATSAGARLLPIEGPPVPSLLQEYRFLQLAHIPGGIYAGHHEPIRTIGIRKVLVCRSELSEDVVYEFTKRLFSVLPSVSSSIAGVRFAALEHAPATPVPLHAGAARYYRERELFQ